MIIDGRQIAQNILDTLKPQVLNLKSKGITPHLSIILIGENASSESYIKQKKLKGEEIGVEIEVHKFDEISEEKLLEIIKDLNNKKEIHGIIVQRPMPPQINKQAISESILREKDVDGFAPNSPFDAPVALAVLKILEEIGIGKNDLIDKRITIIGKGETAGGPIIKLFSKLEIPFQTINSQTENPDEIINISDIVISAVGKEGIIRKDNIKENAILIGVGMFSKNGKLKSDYEVEEIEGKSSFYTPTPGGVGPVNVAFLMSNLIKAAENLSA